MGVIAFLLCAVVLSSAVGQDDGIPKIVDPVTDLTNTLTRSQYYSIRKQIIQFEDSTSNQIVVLIIPTLQGNEIRDYGIKTLEKNKIGQQGKDNGILILVAKDDRLVSIEVGYGLEGAVTDAICDDIIRNEMRPRFREGDYYGGISSAIQSVTFAAKGEYTASQKRKKKSDWVPVLFVVFVIIVSVVASFRKRSYAISSRGHRGYNNWWWGGGGFGGGSSFGSFGGGGGGGGWSAGGGSFGGGGASGSW